MKMRDVVIEADAAPLIADVDVGKVESALENLIEHAAATMPHGGEITVTLIDGNYQWELEVADTSNFGAVDPVNARDGLPQIIPEVIDRHLVNAHRLAMQQNGQIQTWNCPQGGVANVLIVPKLSGDSHGKLSRTA